MSNITENTTETNKPYNIFEDNFYTYIMRARFSEDFRAFVLARKNKVDEFVLLAETSEGCFRIEGEEDILNFLRDKTCPAFVGALKKSIAKHKEEVLSKDAKN